MISQQFFRPRLRLIAPGALLLLWACGAHPAGSADAGDPGYTPGPTPTVADAGLTLSCPTGYTLDSAVSVTFNGQTSADSCWQATLSSSSPVLVVQGLPDFALGPLQLTVSFNATDSSGAACAFAANMTIPLTSSCITVEGSNVTQWYTFSNVAGPASPAGSLTINQWPGGQGQPVSVTFSSDATLVQRQQASPATVTIAGSFTLNATSGA